MYKDKEKQKKAQRERTRRYRDKQKGVTSEGVTECDKESVRASLEHYWSHPDLYATRTDAESLNWGKYMNSQELKDNGFRANRVSLPGDWDYEGAGHLPTPVQTMDEIHNGPISPVEQEHGQGLSSIAYNMYER